MPVDIGANNAVWIGLETTYGTAVDPTAAGVGVWMPILDEALVYTENKYYSPQIRQQAMVSAVVPAPYHVTGPIHFEVDVNYLPYLLYASRHTVVKTGPASGVYTYTVTPTGSGATYPGGSAKGLSILVVRNGIGFLYSGCVIGQWSFTITGGILECTATVTGLAETDPSGATSPSYIAASLFGADASSIYLDAAGLTPAFASASVLFDGYTVDINHNAEAMNRINPTRSANFIKYGVTDVGVTSTVDFLDKTEYNNFKNSTLKAIKLEANKPGGAGTFAAATEAVQITNYRGPYDQYTVDTKGMADLVSAAVNFKSLAIAGGSGYKIVCKSPVNIT